MSQRGNIRDDLKLLNLKAKYSCNQIFRKLQISYILFAVSVFISLLILFPSLFQAIPVLEMINKNGIFQYKLTLSGDIFLSEDSHIQYPITVAVGGYSKQITSGTDFSLVFLSATRSDIPIIVSDESGWHILEYVSFDGNLKEVAFNFDKPLGDGYELCRNYFSGN